MWLYAIWFSPVPGNSQLVVSLAPDSCKAVTSTDNIKVDVASAWQSRTYLVVASAFTWAIIHTPKYPLSQHNYPDLNNSSKNLTGAMYTKSEFFLNRESLVLHSHHNDSHVQPNVTQGERKDCKAMRRNLAVSQLVWQPRRRMTRTGGMPCPEAIRRTRSVPMSQFFLPEDVMTIVVILIKETA